MVPLLTAYWTISGPLLIAGPGASDAVGNAQRCCGRKVADGRSEIIGPCCAMELSSAASVISAGVDVVVALAPGPTVRMHILIMLSLAEFSSRSTIIPLAQISGKAF